jgi:hypothetical protein
MCRARATAPRTALGRNSKSPLITDVRRWRAAWSDRRAQLRAPLYLDQTTSFTPPASGIVCLTSDRRHLLALRACYRCPSIRRRFNDTRWKRVAAAYVHLREWASIALKSSGTWLQSVGYYGQPRGNGHEVFSYRIGYLLRSYHHGFLRADRPTKRSGLNEGRSGRQFAKCKSGHYGDEFRQKRQWDLNIGRKRRRRPGPGQDAGEQRRGEALRPAEQAAEIELSPAFTPRLPLQLLPIPTS